MEQPAPFSSPSTYAYDVFLNFRGVDTRTGFTGNLYSALSQKGVMTFIDADALRRGEEITPSLLNAIRKSRMALVIFSKNYASSTFCLDELVQILECYTQQNMWIWPIFFDVDPSEVRSQKGSYGEAFSKHEQGRFKNDPKKVQKWRLALTHVASLSGWHFKHGGEYEHEFIRKIIEEVSRKLNRPLLHIANYPVGLEARMQHIQWLLDAEFDDRVSVLGIHGIGGSGKSTIARAIYNSIAYKFEGSCFLANVREKSTRHGLEHVQETMLSALLGERNIKLGDVNQGISLLKERLCQKKVLLILDDVDKKEQLEATAGGLDWFGFGSIIIITTRDKHLLSLHGVEHLYKVKKFNEMEAVQLFLWNAFRNREVDPCYTDVILRAIYYTGGLPLALETVGSNLFDKTFDEWKSAIEAYERIPQRNIQEILKVSYDGLEENEKDIFLDIACFFNGCTVRYITNMLDARGFHAKYGLSVLEKKGLINIGRFVEYDGDKIVTMNDLIQHMGKEIVRQQSTYLEKRKRLWFYEDIIYVLEQNKENSEIEAIMLDMPEDQHVQWNQEVFGKMENLRMLIKKNASCFKSPIHLPDSIRVLEWCGYPEASLPSNFHSKNLVILNLSHSCFQWVKPLEISMVLSRLIFTSCELISQIPDVSGTPNLTELCVDDCINLAEIHDSVGFLDNLKRFSAERCTKLKIVPRGIKLTSLEYLSLRDCTSLVNFPEILGPMEKLEFVDLGGTAIENLPASMQNLGHLQVLQINRCKLLENNVLFNIIQMLPNFFPSLGTLDLQDSNLTILPACIEECRFLKTIKLQGCKELQEIKGLPPCTNAFSACGCTSLNADCSTLNMLLQSQLNGSIKTARVYFLPGRRIPQWFDHRRRGNTLRFWFRKDFPAYTLCAVLGACENIEHPFNANFNFVAKLNGIEVLPFNFNCPIGTDHIFMFNFFFIPMDFVEDHEWNCGEFSFSTPNYSASIKWTGVYINRGTIRMEDIRFTNPYPVGSETVEQSKEWRLVRQFMKYLYCDSDSPEPAWGNNDISNHLDSLEPAWGSDDGSDDLDSPEPAWGSDDDCYNDLEPAWDNDDDSSNDLDGSVLDHLARVFGESSTSEGSAELQNIRSPTSSSGQLRHELHHETSSTMFPTTIDTSMRNQTEDDDVEMKAFYASLDAETHIVSHSHEKSVTTAPSEEIKQALKIVQDFISSDASVLLHPEQCNVVKTNLEYLSNLSPDDGISREMRTLISEASREVTHWSKDYIKACMKMDSTECELQRANEIETSLESNRKRFRELEVLENEMLENLAHMEESKKELAEQLSVIEANISASQSEKNIARKRKRDAFEEGKRLKTQRDELRGKTPHLQHEYSLAQETQTRIKAEWSELRKKFKISED